MHLPLLVRSLKQKVCLVELVQVSYIDQPCHCCRILKSQPFRKAWFSNVGVVLNFIKKKSCRPEFPFPFEDQLTFLSSPSDATVNKGKKGKNNTTERFSVKEENAMICFPQKKRECHDTSSNLQVTSRPPFLQVQSKIFMRKPDVITAGSLKGSPNNAFQITAGILF
jgi:hypothetical protein